VKILNEKKHKYFIQLYHGHHCVACYPDYYRINLGLATGSSVGNEMTTFRDIVTQACIPDDVGCKYLWNVDQLRNYTTQ
jgi:hypothetical protein